MKKTVLEEEIKSAPMPGGYNHLFISHEEFIYIVFVDITNPAGQENQPQEEYRYVGEKTYQISVGNSYFHFLSLVSRLPILITSTQQRVTRRLYTLKFYHLSQVFVINLGCYSNRPKARGAHHRVNIL